MGPVYAVRGGRAPPAGRSSSFHRRRRQHWENTLDASRRIYDVSVDPRDPNLVYAAGFEASAFRSADRRKTWTRIRGFNFKDRHRVILDPADISKIHFTTFGSSVWIPCEIKRP
jgi:hypothetical protein